jgi:hypothetical protein
MSLQTSAPRRKLFPAALLIALLGCAFVSATAQNSLSKTPSSVRAKPTNFAILVDTSGSMVGLYQRRDPRPTLVLELVQSLITETMRPGDRLVVLPFDSKVHNQPGEFVAIEDLKPGAALDQIEKLGLQPQSGKGTARTAALGAGAKALRALTNTSGDKNAGFGGGIIFVVTDADNDAAPTDSEGKALFQNAQTMQKSDDLTQLARIPQSGIILEVWRLKSTPGTPQPKLETAISKVQALLKGILPDHIVTNGPLTADIQNGQFTLTPQGKWQRTKDGFELPVTLKSNFKMLYFRGDLQPNVQLTDGNGKDVGKAQLVFDKQPLTVAPGSSMSGKLLVTGTPAPGVLSLSDKRFKAASKPTGKGVATTQPKLFDVPNPAAAARVSEAIWIDPWTPDVAMTTPLPVLPPLSPSRGLQLLLLAILVGVLLGAWKLFGPKPVPPLSVHYWVEGEGTPRVASLSARNAASDLLGVNARLQRPEAESAVVVQPVAGSTLLDNDHKEQTELRFTGGGRFFVRGADGTSKVVNFAFGKNPPQPEETKNEDFGLAAPRASTPGGASGGSTPGSGASSGDDWGLS